MVGGLVQQQQVRLGQQQLAKRNAHLPAAGKLFRVARPVFLAKSQSVEHRADLRVQRIAVVHVELAGDALVAIGHLRVFGGGMVELAHLVRELFHLLLQRAQVAEDRHAFVEDGAAGELQAILRQIAESRVLGGGDAAVIERLKAAQNLQQRGFAGAVGADQADAIMRSDQPVEIVEQELGAEAFAGGRELNHRRERLIASSFWLPQNALIMGLRPAKPSRCRASA